MRCPSGNSQCEGQAEQSGDEGCKESDLGYWFKDQILHPEPPKEPPKPHPSITLAQLPKACEQVLNAPNAKQKQQHVMAGRANFIRHGVRLDF
jgi:penicillin-insensitive murein DD-endopeptidase